MRGDVHILVYFPIDTLQWGPTHSALSPLFIWASSSEHCKNTCPWQSKDEEQCQRQRRRRRRRRKNTVTKAPFGQNRPKLAKTGCAHSAYVWLKPPNSKFLWTSMIFFFQPCNFVYLSWWKETHWLENIYMQWVRLIWGGCNHNNLLIAASTLHKALASFAPHNLKAVLSCFNLFLNFNLDVFQREN